MKVTVFNGSPRGRKSNSHLIAETLLEGAREAGAEVQEVFLIEKDVKQCLGCFSCWSATPGRCVLEDDMAELLELYLDSDYVGLATPVYNMYMTGLLKNFTDRFLPLATPHIQRSDDGTFYHEGRVKRFPQQFFIANSGFPGAHNFVVLQSFYSVVKQMDPGSVLFELYRNCGEGLSASEDEFPELAAKLAEFREALRRAGRELVSTGGVAEATLQKLHMELISDEEYMAGANRFWDEQLDRDED